MSTVRVKSLKPFNATEIYKKRLEAQGATVAEKNTYDPNAKNGYMNSAESADGKREYGAGKEALIVGEPQDAWRKFIIQESILVKREQRLRRNMRAEMSEFNLKSLERIKGKRSNQLFL